SVGVVAVGGVKGLYAQAAEVNGWAADLFGYVEIHGDLHVSGAITAGTKDCRIDDPVDAGKDLQHASVESDAMLDLYSGNVRTDGRGFATVRLPRWFQALNRDFRYQLTPVGQLVLAAVVRPLAHNRFTIETAKPHGEVSWQVTGVRHD